MPLLHPIQEAQEMREDDDLKRATELSLQGMDQNCLHVEHLAVETHEPNVQPGI